MVVERDASPAEQAVLSPQGLIVVTFDAVTFLEVLIVLVYVIRLIETSLMRRLRRRRSRNRHWAEFTLALSAHTQAYVLLL